MFLMRAKHYKGHIQGWAMKIESFCGPEMARASTGTRINTYFREKFTLFYRDTALVVHKYTEAALFVNFTL